MKIGKKMMLWDTCEIVENQVKYLMSEQNNKVEEEFKKRTMQLTFSFIPALILNEIKEEFEYNNEEQLLQSVYEDPDLFNMEWESLCEYLTELMQKKNPNGEWHTDITNFGWRNIEGYKKFHSDNGQDFLSKILPKTDCTFHIYNYGRKGFAINNFHHDSPVGKEWYYIKPCKKPL